MADRICAWCGKKTGEVEGDLISHSICDECSAMLDAEIDNYVKGGEQTCSANAEE
jgi:hypothetical protein